MASSRSKLYSFLLAFLWSAGVVTGAPSSLKVVVHNDLETARSWETVELTAAQLAPLGSDLTRLHVYDGDRELVAQSIENKILIFQTDIAAKSKKSFTVRAGDKRTYRKEDFRVYGRFNRERFDDFAWENDRVAHRMYGTALETWQAEPLTSSTVDVWLKRTRRLVINDWYMTDDYHRDNGEGADFYSAGKSRGCGGSGLWRAGKLVVSKNARNSRVIANGPIRLVFELDYPVWDAPFVRNETKRVTLDAGQNFNRFESRYDADGPILYAAGLKKEPAANFRVEKTWARTWGPVAKENGQFGCAIVFEAAAEPAEADNNQLLLSRSATRHWVGSGWDRGDVRNAADFDRMIEEWAQRIKSPLRAEVTSNE